MPPTFAEPSAPRQACSAVRRKALTADHSAKAEATIVPMSAVSWVVGEARPRFATRVHTVSGGSPIMQTSQVSRYRRTVIQPFQTTNTLSPRRPKTLSIRPERLTSIH